MIEHVKCVHFSQVLLAAFKGEATALILWDSDLSLSSFPEGCQLGQSTQTSLKHTQCEQNIFLLSPFSGMQQKLSDVDHCLMLIYSAQNTDLFCQWSLSPKGWEGQTFCPNIWCFHDCGFNWKCLLFIKTLHLQSQDFKVDKRGTSNWKGIFALDYQGKPVYWIHTGQNFANGQRESAHHI